MSVASFFDASEEERAQWRGHPVTAAFLVWLDEKFAKMADASLAAVRADRLTETKVCLGHLDAIREIRNAIVAPDPAPEAPEEEFVDPAAIWRKR